MSLVFSALVPHPPLLIPDIGREHLEKLKITKESMETLEKNLYISQPDTILLITSHGLIFSDTFTINAYPKFKVDFREFGDLVTKGAYDADLTLISAMANAAKEEKWPLVLQSQENLDYGAAVPLYYLTKHLPKIKIIPLSYSLLDYKKHLDFGYFLKEILMNSERRVAVIASGDLSHRLSNEGPGGFSPLAKKFDDLVLESLKSGNTTGLVNCDAKLCDEAGECGLRSLLILLGILRNMQYKLKILSYESPFGIGYLVAEFIMD